MLFRSLPPPLHCRLRADAAGRSPWPWPVVHALIAQCLPPPSPNPRIAPPPHGTRFAHSRIRVAPPEPGRRRPFLRRCRRALAPLGRPGPVLAFGLGRPRAGSFGHCPGLRPSLGRPKARPLGLVPGVFPGLAGSRPACQGISFSFWNLKQF